MSLLATPTNGLVLVDVDDPHGNGQPTAEIHRIQSDGTTIKTGCYVSVHGGGPLNLRLVHGNPSPSDLAATVFELNSAGRVAISEL